MRNGVDPLEAQEGRMKGLMFEIPPIQEGTTSLSLHGTIGGSFMGRKDGLQLSGAVRGEVDGNRVFAARAVVANMFIQRTICTRRWQTVPIDGVFVVQGMPLLVSSIAFPKRVTRPRKTLFFTWTPKEA